MSDEKPQVPPKVDPNKKRSPGEWMSRLGKYKTSRRIGKTPRRKLPIWQHGAASALHGWGQHQHDADGPILLLEADYLGALKAVDLPTHDVAGKVIQLPAGSTLKPHKAAMSPHCPHDENGVMKPRRGAPKD